MSKPFANLNIMALAESSNIILNPDAAVINYMLWRNYPQKAHQMPYVGEFIGE